MTKKVLVWDLPLRLFHWLFASTILMLWLTAELGSDFIDYHMQLGYFALGLIIFRILWGLIGPKHARFSQFIPSPTALINYIKQSKQGNAPHYAGHNPLGSLMVILMIVLILMQAVSGLFIDDDVYSSGPYYGLMSNGFEKVMSFIHHNVFDFIIAAIVLHLGAIFYYWRVKKQNLVLPMITGKKPADKVNNEDKIPHSKIPLAIIVVALTITFVYWLVVTNAPVFEEFYY